MSVEYEYDTRFPFFPGFHFSAMLFRVLLFNFIGPTEKGGGVPTDLRGWLTESELRKS